LAGDQVEVFWTIEHLVLQRGVQGKAQRVAEIEEGIAVAVKPCGWAIASTYATLVVFAYAVVDVVADAIAVGISRAIAAANANGVRLVSVAVAIPCWNSSAIAHAANVKFSARSVVNRGCVVIVAGC
jgi:hypothetical protein